MKNLNNIKIGDKVYYTGVDVRPLDVNNRPRLIKNGDKFVVSYISRAYQSLNLLSTKYQNVNYELWIDYRRDLAQKLNINPSFNISDFISEKEHRKQKLEKISKS